MNLKSDIKQEIIRLGHLLNLKIAESKSLEDVLLDYLTVKQKLIEPKYRNILISPSLKEELTTHQKKDEILAIIEVAKRGENLNKFQSKRLFQTKFFDHLQNEWNIYHFHLSIELEKKSKFVKQTNSLIFAYIDDNVIAFLGTDTHKEGIFGDLKWIEILHDNFPEIIEPYRDKEIIEYYPKLSAIERQNLWNHGITMGMTELRGKVYHNPGIGRATSGHSIHVTTKVVDITRWVYKLQEQIKDSCDIFCKVLMLEENSEIFGIRITEIGIELYEKTTNRHILKFPETLISKEDMIKRLKETGNQNNET